MNHCSAERHHSGEHFRIGGPGQPRVPPRLYHRHPPDIHQLPKDVSIGSRLNDMVLIFTGFMGTHEVEQSDETGVFASIGIARESRSSMPRCASGNCSFDVMDTEGKSWVQKGNRAQSRCRCLDSSLPGDIASWLSSSGSSLDLFRSDLQSNLICLHRNPRYLCPSGLLILLQGM